MIGSVRNTNRVNSVFEKTIKKYSEKTALVYKERSYTYNQFDKVTKKIASYITSLGILPDEFVAVLAPRNDEAVISAWGVIRSGSAFQILDSAYPADRISYILDDSEGRFVITTHNHVADYVDRAINIEELIKDIKWHLCAE